MKSEPDLGSKNPHASFGAPVGHLGAAPHGRGWVEIGDLVIAVERKHARLRAAIEIWECASLDTYCEHMGSLIKGVGAEIGDAPLYNRLVLVRGAGHAIAGGKLRQIGAQDHDGKTAIPVHHHGTLR